MIGTRLIIVRERDLADALKNIDGLESELKHLSLDLQERKLWLDPDERYRMQRALDCTGFSARCHSMSTFLQSLRDRPGVRFSQIELEEIDLAIFRANGEPALSFCVASPAVKRHLRNCTIAAYTTIGQILRRKTP